jgi:hypothetical protein
MAGDLTGSDRDRFYKINEVNEHRYIKCPKEFLYNPYYRKALDPTSILLYSILLDQMELSRKNGWIEEDGTIYLYATREKLQKMLSISDKTLTRAVRVLVSLGLIAEKRIGLGRPNRIYIGKIRYQALDEVDLGDDIEELPDPEAGDVFDEEVRMYCSGSPAAGTSIAKAPKSMDPEILRFCSSPNPGPKPHEFWTETENEPGADPGRCTGSGKSPDPEPEILRFREEPGPGDVPGPDPEKLRASDTNITKTQSMTDKDGKESRARPLELDGIIRNCNLSGFMEPGVATVMEQALETMYFSETLVVDGVPYPGDLVRQRMQGLNFDILEGALGKIRTRVSRDTQILKSRKYLVSTIYNELCEYISDPLLDPDLNGLGRQLSLNSS